MTSKSVNGRTRKQCAYKVMWSIDPDKPVGQVFLAYEWHGRQYEYHRYNPETVSFEKYMRVRYLGPNTARTNRGKVRQLLALPGTSHFRKRAA